MSTTAGMLRGVGRPANLISEARIMVSSAMADPGDRSIPPTMITSVEPMEIRETMLTCSRMLRRFPRVRKRSEVKPTSRPTSRTATSGPTSDEFLSSSDPQG